MFQSLGEEGCKTLAYQLTLWLQGDFVQAIDQYKNTLEKDNEKTSAINQSMNIKRSLKKDASAQFSYAGLLEEEELLMPTIKKTSSIEESKSPQLSTILKNNSMNLIGFKKNLDSSTSLVSFSE